MSAKPAAAADISALLADLWQRHLPAMRERLALLDRTALLAASGRLDETSRAEAQSVAHKLAGNLGMFGYGDAGTVASKIEEILKAPTSLTLLHLASLARELRGILAPHL